MSHRLWLNGSTLGARGPEPGVVMLPQQKKSSDLATRELMLSRPSKTERSVRGVDEPPRVARYVPRRDSDLRQDREGMGEHLRDPPRNLPAVRANTHAQHGFSRFSLMTLYVSVDFGRFSKNSTCRRLENWIFSNVLEYSGMFWNILECSGVFSNIFGVGPHDISWKLTKIDRNRSKRQLRCTSHTAECN